MRPDFALTPSEANHKISPESSDGFASVGTVLPNEKAALLPGGLFLWRVHRLFEKLNCKYRYSYLLTRNSHFAIVRCVLRHLALLLFAIRTPVARHRVPKRIQHVS